MCGSLSVNKPIPTQRERQRQGDRQRERGGERGRWCGLEKFLLGTAESEALFWYLSLDRISLNREMQSDALCAVVVGRPWMSELL